MGEVAAFTAMQDEREISAFCDLLAREGVRSYLEIGAKWGGSLHRVATALPKGSRIVSIDMPGGTKRWKETEASLLACHADLRRRGYDTHAIWGNSRDAHTWIQADALGPFDAILIDGDHRLSGVTADFLAYGPLGQIIAFHDIAWRRAPEWNDGTRIDVKEFWDSIKGDYRHVEFKFDPTKKNNGLGILWRS